MVQRAIRIIQINWQPCRAQGHHSIFFIKVANEATTQCDWKPNWRWRGSAVAGIHIDDGRQISRHLLDRPLVNHHKWSSVQHVEKTERLYTKEAPLKNMKLPLDVVDVDVAGENIKNEVVKHFDCAALQLLELDPLFLKAWLLCLLFYFFKEAKLQVAGPPESIQVNIAFCYTVKAKWKQNSNNRWKRGDWCLCACLHDLIISHVTSPALGGWRPACASSKSRKTPPHLFKLSLTQHHRTAKHSWWRTLSANSAGSVNRCLCCLASCWVISGGGCLEGDAFGCIVYKYIIHLII